MGEQTLISWTDHTFNPWIGCTQVSPACDHCYAEAWDNRFGGGHWGPGAPRRRTSASAWRQPLRWNHLAGLTGVRSRVFCASLADVFDNQVDPAWRSDLWDLIAACPNLDWLLLTKRPQNIARMLGQQLVGAPHVWLGTTAENQAELDRRLPHLTAVPAGLHFLSCEPLLERVALPPQSGIGWVIVGGESGAGARPMMPGWARLLRDQCAGEGTPFHFKQWGEWLPASQCGETLLKGEDRFYDAAGNPVRPAQSIDRLFRVGKRSAGHLLDGRLHLDFPESPALREAA